MTLTLQSSDQVVISRRATIGGALLRGDADLPAAQQEFLHLAGGGFRKLRDEVESLRALEVREAVARATSHA